MSGFIEGVDRDQVTLFPDRLEDWIGEDHLVRVVDLFVDQLDLADLGFTRAAALSGPFILSARIFRFFVSRLNKVINLSLFDQQCGFVRWLLLVCNNKKAARQKFPLQRMCFNLFLTAAR